MERLVCETVKNITVSVPDQVYRRARMRAARDTSVSALVRDFLASLGDEGSDFERCQRLQAEVLSSVRSFRAAERLKRDEAHDRDALR